MMPSFLAHAHYVDMSHSLQTKLRAACLGIKIRAENGLDNAIDALSLFATRRKRLPPDLPAAFEAETETVSAQHKPRTAPAASDVGRARAGSAGGGTPSAGGGSRGGDMSPRDGDGGEGTSGVRVGEIEEQLVLREMPNGLRVWWSSRAEEETFFIFGEVFEERTYARMGVRVQDGDTVWDIGKVTDVENVGSRKG